MVPDHIESPSTACFACQDVRKRDDAFARLPLLRQLLVPQAAERVMVDVTNMVRNMRIWHEPSRECGVNAIGDTDVASTAAPLDEEINHSSSSDDDE
jgi:hypothetical protein